MISVAFPYRIPANVLYFFALNFSFLSFSALGVGNRAVGGAIFVLMLVMLIANAPRNWDRAKESLVGNRLFFVLVVWLVLATVVSSAWNLKSILSSRQSLTLFASSLASWSFLGVCFAFFKLRVREEGYFWPLSVCIVIFGMAVWEFFSFETAGVVLDQTLRTGNLAPGKVSSVFPSTTEFGPLAALLAMFFLIQVFYCKNRSAAWVVEVMLAGVASVGVVLSGSRTAMAGFVTGVLTLAAYMPSKRRKIFFFILVCLVLAVHMAALGSPYVARKAGSVLPYMHKLHQGEAPNVSDFKPNLRFAELTDRSEHWQKALSFWQGSPLVGIGFGQYNIKSGLGWKNNVHNVYLNLLTEGGLLLFIPFCLLAIVVLARARGTPLIVLLVPLAVMAAVENSYDHLLGWNITVAWVTMMTMYRYRNEDYEIFAN